MARPFQIMGGPFEVWLADVGTAFPKIDAVPGAGWNKLGAGGYKDLGDDGVKVRSEQSIETWRGSGTAVRWVGRTSEDLLVEFTLYDATVESYGQILNDATVTDTAAAQGAAGTKDMALLQGPDVATFAMLIRGDGKSPYGAGFSTQWQIPVVFQKDNPETVYAKGGPVGLKTTWQAVEDDTDGYGKLISQDAAALP